MGQKRFKSCADIYKYDTVPSEFIRHETVLSGSIRRGDGILKYLFFTKHRGRISWIVVSGLLIILVFTRTRFESDVVKTLLNDAGLLLVAIGAFGRIWSSIYISGYKTEVLIALGPYSMVRNPLYIFSFLAVLGIAAASQNGLFLAAIIGAFLLYYPFVVLNEEDELRVAHGDRFERYRKDTPCFIPNFRKFRQPEKYEINVPAYSRAFLDAIWFFVAYIAVDILKFLQANDLIPVWMVL
jgi:protein-S-isoprenylcysteine O-methyltransferase Ste14